MQVQDASHRNVKIMEARWPLYATSVHCDQAVIVHAQNRKCHSAVAAFAGPCTKCRHSMTSVQKHVCATPQLLAQLSGCSEKGRTLQATKQIACASGFKATVTTKSCI